MSFPFLSKLPSVLGKTAYKSIKAGFYLNHFKIKEMYSLSFSGRNENFCTVISLKSVIFETNFFMLKLKITLIPFLIEIDMHHLLCNNQRQAHLQPSL